MSRGKGSCKCVLNVSDGLLAESEISLVLDALRGRLASAFSFAINVKNRYAHFLGLLCIFLDHLL